jgi:hypothetical protein
MSMSRGKKLMLFAPLALVGGAVFVALGAGVVRWLWNYVTPDLFGWRQITFWQALALLALCRILVGGFGLKGGNGPMMRGRLRERVADRMADRVAERWDAMTPEERERFRQRLRERCGFDPGKA